MKHFLLLITTAAVMMANTYTSTVQIPLRDAMKYSYANGSGGTMHARAQGKIKKMKHAESLAKYPLDQAKAAIASRYNDLSFSKLEIVTVGRNVLYKASNENHHYYFDAGNLALVAQKER